MKIHYLKNKKVGLNVYPLFVKINDDGYTLEVAEEKIEFDKTTESFETNIGWYKDTFGMIDCKKQEFDDFYISTAKKLNELSKL